MAQSIVILDGHDGAGKTSVARVLSDRLGYTNARPFAGSLGDHIAWLWKNEAFDAANNLASSAVARQYAIHKESRGVVFDRHWLCLFTVLPERYFSTWMPAPPTVLCWADVTTTIRRLEDRGDPAAEQEHVHRTYCSRYRFLADRFDVPVVNTSQLSVEQSVDAVLGILSDHSLPSGSA